MVFTATSFLPSTSDIENASQTTTTEKKKSRLSADYQGWAFDCARRPVQLVSRSSGGKALI
jgi:hypothetical protein